MYKRIVCIIFTLTPFLGHAQLQVGTIERVPFAISQDSNREGFSLDLWKRAATELGLKYELIIYENFSEMLNDVEHKNIDLAVANISITAAREKIMDFSYPIYDSGLQLLKRTPEKISIKNIFSQGIGMRIVAGFFALFLISTIVKKYSTSMISIPTSGILILLRVIGGGYMVIHASNLLQGDEGFIAHTASAFDIHHIIKEQSIGAAKGTTMSTYLDNHNIDYITYDDFSLSLQALEAGEIDIIIADAAIAKYYASHEGRHKVETIGPSFAPDKIAIAFPSQHRLKNRVNKKLLELKESGTYEYLQEKYFDEVY